MEELGKWGASFSTERKYGFVKNNVSGENNDEKIDWPVTNPNRISVETICLSVNEVGLYEKPYLKPLIRVQPKKVRLKTPDSLLQVVLHWGLMNFLLTVIFSVFDIISAWRNTFEISTLSGRYFSRQCNSRIRNSTQVSIFQRTKQSFYLV